MVVRSTAIAALLFLLAFSAPAWGAWERVKHFVQPEAVIEEESEDRLVLSYTDDAGQVRIVLTATQQPDSDIYADTERRRGGNPYRIWVATLQLWQDPDRPRREWGRLFRSQFLRAVREPRRSSETTIAR